MGGIEIIQTGKGKQGQVPLTRMVKNPIEYAGIPVYSEKDSELYPCMFCIFRVVLSRPENENGWNVFFGKAVFIEGVLKWYACLYGHAADARRRPDAVQITVSDESLT